MIAPLYTHQSNHIPKGEHWAILVDRSVTIPADARSMESPGHGYPETTERYMEYLAFSTEMEMLAELHQLVRNYPFLSPPAKGIHVSGTYVSKTTAQVEIVPEQ